MIPPSPGRGEDAPDDGPFPGPTGRPYTVVYDGSCGICGKLVGMLERWDRDGELELIPSQHPDVPARYPWIPARAYQQSIQVIHNPAGQTWQGAAAIERLLDVLPKGSRVSWIFSIPFVRPAAEKFYRWFAMKRYHLGCGRHCRRWPEP